MTMAMKVSWKCWIVHDYVVVTCSECIVYLYTHTHSQLLSILHLYIYIHTCPCVEDGFDETLIPVDYKTAGQIRDDDLFKCLVGAFDEGVTVTCIMDCCHSGTVLDLPYEFRGDGSQTEMTAPAGFNYNKLLQLAHAAANAGLLGKNGKQNVQKLENAAQMAAQCGGCAIM